MSCLALLPMPDARTRYRTDSAAPLPLSRLFLFSAQAHVTRRLSPPLHDPPPSRNAEDFLLFSGGSRGASRPPSSQDCSWGVADLSLLKTISQISCAVQFSSSSSSPYPVLALDFRALESIGYGRADLFLRERGLPFCSSLTRRGALPLFPTCAA